MTEWREIPEYPGYFVSDEGQIIGRSGKILKPSRISHKSGHLQVSVRVGGKTKHLRLHRAVLLAFVGLAPEGLEACHNNRDETDNHVSNLRWDTHHNNLLDRKVHGTDNAGERQGLHKLTEDEVLYIRSSNTVERTLANELGVSRGAVNDVRRGVTWRHLLKSTP